MARPHGRLTGNPREATGEEEGQDDLLCFFFTLFEGLEHKKSKKKTKKKEEDFDI